MSETALRLRSSFVPAGWYPVPAGLSPHEVGERLKALVVDLRSSFGTRWHDDFAPVVAATVVQLAAGRPPGGGLAFACWPAPVPFAIVVDVSVVESSSVPPETWSDLGYRAETYWAPYLGSGVQWVRRRAVVPDDARESEPLRLVSTAYVFADGGESVLVRVAETTLELAAAFADGLQAFLTELRVDRPDGVAWGSVPSPAISAGAHETWEFDV